MGKRGRREKHALTEGREIGSQQEDTSLGEDGEDGGLGCEKEKK